MIESIIRTFLLIFSIFVFTILSFQLIPTIFSYQNYYGKKEVVALSRNLKVLLDYCVMGAITEGYTKVSVPLPDSIQRNPVIIYCFSNQTFSKLVISSKFGRYTFTLPSSIKCNFEIITGRPKYYMVCEKINNTIIINMIA